MVPLKLLLSFRNLTVLDGGKIRERLVKDDDKVILEIIGNSPAIPGGVANDLFLFRDDLYKRSFIKCICDNKRILAVGKREAEYCRSFCRRDLCCYIVVGEVYPVVVGFRDFRFMREPARALVLIKDGLSSDRHDGELSIVVHPRAG